VAESSKSNLLSPTAVGDGIIIFLVVLVVLNLQVGVWVVGEGGLILGGRTDDTVTTVRFT
jgi:hypothetical protein